MASSPDPQSGSVDLSAITMIMAWAAMWVGAIWFLSE